ncbi:MAG: hypothetical protein CSA82_01470 [Actinobacteria bacterium]|nr:MAG: hypothetical protein CSA82_01470 [Actinomycetota bacterium]
MSDGVKVSSDEVRKGASEMRTEGTPKRAEVLIEDVAGSQHERKWGTEPGAKEFASTYETALRELQADTAALSERATQFAEALDAFLRDAQNAEEEVEARARFLDYCRQENLLPSAVDERQAPSPAQGPQGTGRQPISK